MKKSLRHSRLTNISPYDRYPIEAIKDGQQLTSSPASYLGCTGGYTVMLARVITSASVNWTTVWLKAYDTVMRLRSELTRSKCGV